MVTLRFQEKRIDRLILGLVLVLTCFGILMVYEASSVTAFRDFGDELFYVRQQIVWAILGSGALLFFAKFDYRRLEGIAPFFMLVSFILLFLVLIPGLGIKALGARRWLSLGFFNFQPAELAKIAFILYISSLLSKKPQAFPFLVVSGILLFLVMLEPDLGTTVILVCSGFSLYFASGAPLLLSTVFGILTCLLGFLLIFSSPYRKERFLTFLDIGRDPLGASYHIRQVLLALGSGGFFGVGFGASRQKYAYLPEAMTDSIFAIIAEELGFFGSVILILAFLVLIYRGLKIAHEAPDRFGQLLGVGITSLVGIQALVNLASMVALVPLTGVPLPFVSYGGSSLVIAMVALGILLNISKHRVERR